MATLESIEAKLSGYVKAQDEKWKLIQKSQDERWGLVQQNMSDVKETLTAMNGRSRNNRDKLLSLEGEQATLAAKSETWDDDHDTLIRLDTKVNRLAGAEALFTVVITTITAWFGANR